MQMARWRQAFWVMLALALWLCLQGVSPLPAQGAPLLRVVTTTSDLKSLVVAVGGDRVSVSSIALPAQDPHTFEPKPASLQLLQQADLVVKIGLDHDLWIERLLQESGNPNLQPGAPGYVDTSVSMPLLEVRSRTLAPTAGHNHGAGNPHYWLDPTNAELITGWIRDGLVRVDPDHLMVYEANRDRFLATLQTKMADWETQLAPYQGRTIVAYHNSWPYLARHFRLNVVDWIEPKPGVPPSPTHLSALLREIKEHPGTILVKEPYETDRVPRLLSQKTGAPMVTLISSVGAVPEVQDYFALFDYDVRALVHAFDQVESPP